jgi:predicted O-methyltransferase YrrM
MSQESSSQALWTAVDRYIDESLIPSDPILEDSLRANAEAHLPSIDVAPNQGKFLHLLARIQGSRRILEIGTLGGYSTIWLTRALPIDGKLVTLEVDPNHASVATANIQRAGLSSKVELRLGPALESLSQLHAEASPPFDFIFIDADKPNNPAYLEWSLRLSRPGTVIVCDNVVREGGIIDPDSTDPMIQGTRHLFELLTANPRIDATCVQTVGGKGHDGFILGVVKSV